MTLRMRLALPKIYPVTDTRISGLSHVEQATRLIDGGAKLIQLRDKHAAPRDFYEQVLECVRIAHKCGARIIVNDRADIALAADADGVHLGQDDLPCEKARILLGKNAIIGLSTHSVEQARLALNSPVDYIAIGPVFSTASKEKPDPVVGLDGLRAVRAVVGDTPLVAIGGIDEANLTSVFNAGADSAAMISSILSDAGGISSRLTHLTSQIA